MKKKLVFEGEYIPQGHDISQVDWNGVLSYVMFALCMLAVVVVFYNINKTEKKLDALLENANHSHTSYVK